MEATLPQAVADDGDPGPILIRAEGAAEDRPDAAAGDRVGGHGGRGELLGTSALEEREVDVLQDRDALEDVGEAREVPVLGDRKEPGEQLWR